MSSSAPLALIRDWLPLLDVAAQVELATREGKDAVEAGFHLRRKIAPGLEALSLSSDGFERLHEVSLLQFACVIGHGLASLYIRLEFYNVSSSTAARAGINDGGLNAEHAECTEEGGVVFLLLRIQGRRRAPMHPSGTSKTKTTARAIKMEVYGLTEPFRQFPPIPRAPR